VAAGDVKAKIESANKEGINRILTAKPFLVGVKPAIEVLPEKKVDIPCRSSNRVEENVWSHERSDCRNHDL
jgi:hypothetical protein